jgi:ankyrin repeat protein
MNPCFNVADAAGRGNLFEILRLLDKGKDVNGTVTDYKRPLEMAIMMGHASAVELLCSKGSAKERREDGRTPLHQAIQSAHVDVVKALLEAGADKEAKTVNDGSFGSRTPLQIVACPGLMDDSKRLKMLKLLCEHGADVNVIDTATGNTLLILYLSRNLNYYKGWEKPTKEKMEEKVAIDLEIVKTMIAFGAKIDTLSSTYVSQDYYRQTQPALFHAIEHGAVKIIELFVKHSNANANLLWERFNRSMSPLFYLVSERLPINIQLQIAIILIEDGRANINFALKKSAPVIASDIPKSNSPKYMYTSDDDSVLHAAVEKAYLLNTEGIFADEDNDEAFEEEEKREACSIADETSNPASTQSLAEKESESESEEKQKRKAQFNVCVVKYLCSQNHMQKNQRNTYGYTPLHTAVKAGSVEIVKILLETGNDINVQNVNGFSALHTLGYDGQDKTHISTCKLLLLDPENLSRSIPDMSTRDMHGRTPYMCALRKRQNSEDIPNVQIQKMMKSSTPIFGQCGCIIS